MSDLIAVTGNLTSPPERRDLAGGVTMATFGLATTERRLTNGVWNDVHTNFYRVAAYRRLAEHALSSLEKGQRVIVAGRLKLKPWEAGGRSGTNVDIEATSMGPDLMFGVASFVKDPPAGARATDTPADGDGWAVPGAGVDGESADIVPGQVATTPPRSVAEPGTVPGSEPGAVPGAEPAAEPAARPQLVSAGDWGADPTPF